MNHQIFHKKQFKLPHGCSVVRIQNLEQSQKKRLIPQIFALIKAQYPGWYLLERQNNWLNALSGGNENGTKIAISAVLDSNGSVLGASAVELYANATAIINYSIANPLENKYLDIIYAATKDMASAIREMQKKGEAINFICKEHHLDSQRAYAGYYAVGQVPIDGPTSLIQGHVKYYEVAYGNPEDVNNPEEINKALGLADPKTGKPQDKDDAVHLWLIQDFAPSNSQQALPELLRAFALSYVREHSIFREKDFRLDPAYQALNEIANRLPSQATYQQAATASAIGAAKYIGLA